MAQVFPNDQYPLNGLIMPTAVIKRYETYQDGNTSQTIKETEIPLTENGYAHWCLKSGTATDIYNYLLMVMPDVEKAVSIDISDEDTIYIDGKNGPWGEITVKD